MKKINVGIMGCASIARRYMIPAFQTLDGFDVKAVASRFREKAEDFAGQFGCEPVTGYENLLYRSDIDAVYIPLPTGLHHEWVMKSLEAGKHVLVEKSLAKSLGSATEMVEIARAGKLALMENFMFVYHSQHEFVKKLIDNNEIGEFRVFRGSFGYPPLPDTNFRYNDTTGGGALFDAAGYPVRAALMFLGQPLNVKSASIFHDVAMGTNISGGALLEGSNGVIAQLSWGMDHFYQCNYEILGSRGKISATHAYTPRPEQKPSVILEKQDEKHEFQLPCDNHFIGILKEFNRIVSGSDYETQYNYALMQALILQEIRKLSEK